MGNLFVKFDIAVSANLAGFKEECFAYYHTNQIDKELNFMHHNQDGNSIIPIKHPNILKVHDALSAPTIQQLVDWFLTVYDIDISVKRVGAVKNQDYFVSYIDFGWASEEFKTRKDALSKVIEEAFEMIKK